MPEGQKYSRTWLKPHNLDLCLPRSHLKSTIQVWLLGDGDGDGDGDEYHDDDNDDNDDDFDDDDIDDDDD